jgi:hypothetical protein
MVFADAPSVTGIIFVSDEDEPRSTVNLAELADSDVSRVAALLDELDEAIHS